MKMNADDAVVLFDLYRRALLLRGPFFLWGWAKFIFCVGAPANGHEQRQFPAASYYDDLDRASGPCRGDEVSQLVCV